MSIRSRRGPLILLRYFCTTPGAHTHSFSGWLKYPHGHPCVGLLPSLEIRYSIRPYVPYFKDYPQKAKTFGNRLKLARMEKGLSQYNLAKELEVSEDSISRWENDYYLPLNQLQMRIIKYFGNTVDSN